MNRREVLSGLGGLAALGLYGTGTASAAAPEVSGEEDSAAQWPFRGPSVINQWTKILAEGFPAPVPGYVFEGCRLESGVPLGGLGTGYFTLDGNGKIGYSTLFNQMVPPDHLSAEWLYVLSGTKSVPLSTTHITYWGHYPVADMTAQLDELPLSLGIRAFTPFIVGDAAASNTPVAIFDLEVRNHSSQPLSAELHLRFPAANHNFKGEKPADLVVSGPGVVAQDADAGEYYVSVNLLANGSQRVQFVVGWYAPVWRDSGGEPRYNRYMQRFKSAVEAADFGLRNREALLRRVLAWQNAIYSSDMPDWLCDALVQGFYSMPKNSVWIARTRKDDWWGENGWFTHSESHTGCPIVETMVCRMHGHFALLFFFPDLEETTLNAFRYYQISSGEIPFSFGAPTSMRDPRYLCQHPLNSGEYAQMVYQYYLRTGDQAVIKKFYESTKHAIRYQYTLDDDNCGLVHDHSHALPGESWPANQFYDIWPWHGTSSYVAGIWLATLTAGAALAKAAGDSSFAAECATRLSRAKGTFENNLWTGSYYRLWNDRLTDKVNDVSLANQLMAVWCTRVAGLEDVLPSAHIHAALDTIERLNMNATAYGMINAVTPDGKRYAAGGSHAQHIFFGEILCAAMTLLYENRRETGLEIARRLYNAVAVKNPSPWNQRCLIDGETGMPLWGTDYYSDLAIWAFPMALAGQSVGEFAHGSLVKTMIAAANE